MESSRVTIQKNAIEQCFPVVLFGFQYLTKGNFIFSQF